VARRKAGAGGDNDSIAGYFRKVFAEKPQLLKGRSNEELLRRWQEDHPGQEVSKSVKASLSNIKSVLRSKGRKRARKEAADHQERDVPAGVETKRSAPPRRGMNALEEAIDECLGMAKATDREGLAGVIDLLRRARNQVVWKMGEPG
jgi:hypothetical protein